MTAAYHEEEALGKPLDLRLLVRLLRYLRPYAGMTAGAIAMLLGLAVLQLAGPYLTQLAIDRAIPARDLHLVAVLGAVMATALVAEFGLEYAQTVLTAFIGQRVMVDLRQEIFRKLQRLSIAFYDRNPVGRLMTRVTSDVETLNDMFTGGVVALFGDVFTLLVIMAWMLAVDVRLSLVSFAVIPFVAAAAKIFQDAVRGAYRRIRVKLARINAFLQEHVTGMRVVQLFGREAQAYGRFEAVNREYLDANLASIVAYALFFPAIEVLTSVALASILLYGGDRVLGHTLTVGVLAAFLQLARRFFRPLQDLSEKYNILQSAMASSERVFKLLDTAETVRDPAQPRALPRPVRGTVAFEDVWFRYPARDGGRPATGADSAPPAGSSPDTSATARDGGRPATAADSAPPAGSSPDTSATGRDGREPAADSWVLRGVSFTARPGETVALVGHTGAGKTTVINLLLRFYDVDRGRVTVDGVDVREIAQRELRELIGLVQQDVFLFTGDIAANIRLGFPIPDAAVEAASRRVGAHRFIERLPDRYAHRLGERGQSVSVGERQLLAFARALAADPAILVLDEATSSVDAQAEELIQNAIAELMRGRTNLVVAHRLSTVQHADTILVLHHGAIRERGSHRELLAAGGLYERLYQLQLGAAQAALP